MARKIWLCLQGGCVTGFRDQNLLSFNQMIGEGGWVGVHRTKNFNFLLQPCVNHLSLFLFPSQMKPMLTTIGTLDPPLGNARLQASKLIAAILATNSDTINAELAKLGTLQVLWVCIQIKIQFTSIKGVTFYVMDGFISDY